MLTFDEARSRILALAPTSFLSERVSRQNALGRVLSVDIAAPGDQPLFDQSAMDGYAFCFRDVVGQSNVTLPVKGESRAGSALFTLEPNTACRIFTGAAVPTGADSVVMQERVTRENDSITFEAPTQSGGNIRRRGEDIRQGTIALRTGTYLSARHIALAAALEQSELLVNIRPRVTVLLTGDELRSPGAAPRAGSIPESLGDALACISNKAGAIASLGQLLPDNLDTIVNAFGAAIDCSDIVVSVGGASVGDHDLVKPALLQIGANIDFWKVAIKPGKPILVGQKGKTLVIGLPGNPTSAIVTFCLFGVPLIRAWQGNRAPVVTPMMVHLGHSISRSAGRLEFARATLDRRENGLWANIAKNQASGAVTVLSESDGLLMLGAEQTDIEKDSLIPFLPWVELGA